MKTTTSLLALTSSLIVFSTGCARTQAAPPQAPPAAPARAEVQRTSAPTARTDQARPPAGPAVNSREIRVAVSSISDDIQQCYLAGTFKDSNLAGTVHVTFTIEPTGRVSSVTDAGSDMADQDVVACVVDLFAGLSFRPGGQNSTEVTYPITFHRRG